MGWRDFKASCSLVAFNVFVSNDRYGPVQERQDLKFPAPTYPGDEMTLMARVVAVAGPRATLVVDVIDPGGTVTCTGEAVLRSAAT